MLSALFSEDLLEQTDKRGSFVKEPNSKETKLSLMGWMASEDSGKEVWKQLAENFETSQTNASVSTQTAHYSELQQQLIQLAGKGEAPDVAQISCNWAGKLSSLGMLESLEDKLSKNVIDDHLILKHGNAQSNSIDYGFVPALLYINCDLLEECGIDSTKDPQTLDEFMNIIKSVNKIVKGKHGYIAPNLSDEVTGQWFLPWLYAEGGDFFDDKGKLHLAEHKAINALKSYKKCLKQSPHNVSAWDIRKLFEEGRSAFLVDGPKGESFFKDSEINFRVTSLPKDPRGNSISVNANHALTLFSQSENIETGIKLIEMILSDKELAKLNFKEQGIVPTRQSLLADDIYKEEYPQLVLQEALNGRRVPSHLPSYQLAIGLLGHAVSRVINEDADPATTLKETERNIEYLLNS